MRILLLTDRLPFPLSNGQNIRIYHYVKRLRARHHFALVTYGMVPHPPELRSIFAEIRTLGPKPALPPRPPFTQRLRHALVPETYLHYDAATHAAIDETLRTGSFDLLWISGWEMLVYLPLISPLPTLADIVDEGVLEHLHGLRHARGLGSFLLSTKRLIRSLLFERHYFTRADACTVVAERDALWGRRVVPGAHFAVVHNGVDTDYFAPGGYDTQPLKLVFEGNMGFEPNVDAALYFIRRILPRIRRAIPHVQFYAVGTDPAPELIAAQDAGTVVTGFVDDIRPHLGTAAVFVCPMRLGAGIKNKLLQAWSMARAVVATPVACGGLRVEPGRNLEVERSSNAFAESVVRLLLDPRRQVALGAAGRETVLRYYTWDRQASELDRVFHWTVGHSERMRLKT